MKELMRQKDSFKSLPGLKSSRQQQPGTGASAPPASPCTHSAQSIQCQQLLRAGVIKRKMHQKAYKKMLNTANY